MWMLLVHCEGAGMALSKGTTATKAFYDNIAWQPEDNGVLGDWNRFVWAHGPVQRALDLERRRRIANLVTPGLEIIELARISHES
jgi:hypothetical protein